MYKEKIFDTPDHMDFVHALCILHALWDLCRKHHADDVADALDVIFCWIDDTSLLTGEIVKEKEGVHERI